MSLFCCSDINEFSISIDYSQWELCYIWLLLAEGNFSIRVLQCRSNTRGRALLHLLLVFHTCISANLQTCRLPPLYL